MQYAFSCHQNAINTVYLIDHESDGTNRVIMKAIWIKPNNMNQDDGRYQLSHVSDKLIIGVRNRK